LTIKELLKRYKGLHLSKPSFDAMVLVIINNSETRAVLDSFSLNYRAFVCMEQGNLLVGRKCLEVRVPYDLWHGRVVSPSTIPVSNIDVADCPVKSTFTVERNSAEIVKLRAWVRSLAVAGTHAFDPGQRHRSTIVLNEIDRDACTVARGD